MNLPSFATPVPELTIQMLARPLFACFLMQDTEYLPKDLRYNFRPHSRGCSLESNLWENCMASSMATLHIVL